MEIEEIAKKLIEEYKGVFDRLKAYDEGKIEINTDKLDEKLYKKDKEV